MPNLTLNEPLTLLAEEHRQWLAPHDHRHAKKWERLLKTDIEAALTEAGIRRLLVRNNTEVEPNEALTGKCGGPDFRCTHDESKFYVEVTCLSIETAARRSGLTRDHVGFSPINATGLIDAALAECKNKVSQCSNLDAPALVAIGTFHGIVAMACFKKEVIRWVLTGKTALAWDIDPETGEHSEAYECTALESAAFLRASHNPSSWEFCRAPISGVVFCAAGLESMKSVGVLNPRAVRPFDCRLLSGIEFGSLQMSPTGALNVSW